MANVTAGDPFIIDTATNTAIYTDRFQLQMLVWTSGSAADTVSVQDSGGTVRYAGVTAAANAMLSANFPDGFIFNGLKVPTLSAGTLYLWVKRT